jgi:hypothetical protein
MCAILAYIKEKVNSVCLSGIRYINKPAMALYTLLLRMCILAFFTYSAVIGSSLNESRE